MSINETDPSHDWVIDGLMEHRDRLILTGFEGVGKSSLLEQIAVCCAAGIHPFTGQPQPRQRVLLVDCENSERRVHRSLRLLKETANTKGYATNSGLCTFFEPRGLDFGHQSARALVELAIDYAPDLLIIGPLYRMTPADLNDEYAARTIVRELDEVRLKANCAVIVEAHPGRTENGTPRTLTPRGSSLFLRWPDFGVGLRPIGDQGAAVALTHWRGPREERPWPLTLKRNTDNDGWPWLAGFRSSSADTEEN